MQIADVFASSQYPGLMWLLVVLAVMLAMFFARTPAHRAILAFSRVLHYGLRLSARSLVLAANKLRERNREVLMAHGRVAKERIIEREFERVAASVQRDLGESPTINRRLAEDITKIEEDHSKSMEVPPAPPGWINAVKSVADVDARGDPMVAKILEGIHDSLVKAQNQATDDYRKACAERHGHLKSMAPQWRKVSTSLGEVEGKVTSVLQRTQVIDRHIEEYENILKQTDRAERQLSSSSLVDFFISLFVLTIAVGGAFINFNLIARPMSEMVGGNTYVGTMKVADIAAMVIILVELSMGLFLMESLRITRLFPVIGALSDKWRIIMIWITLSLLTSLALVEAGLAYMREILLQDQLATSALLRGDFGGGAATGATQFQWITMVAQMGLGFILPYALTFVAIPLETFVHALRTVLGMFTVGALRGLATILRVIGEGFRLMGVLLVDLYDLIISVPLWAAKQFKPLFAGSRKPARG